MSHKQNLLPRLALDDGGGSQLTCVAWCVLPGMGGFAALEALKTKSSSSRPCTSVLEAAMMVPELSQFVATAQVRCCAVAAAVSCTH